MKILHTADWHIGKKLHKHDLYEDFDLFINWLCEIIAQQQIEILLISGDVFDLANPSAEARRQYYKSLILLQKLKCKIIITGGNHDSPAMLDAPKEILKELDMHVIGGLPENLEDTIIPVHGENGSEVVIAAIPYLRDADLRYTGEANTYEDRLEALRKGIENTFNDVARICEAEYKGIPTIAMGHLYTAGIESSESERDIQIGNQAAFYASQFGEYFKYIALGHVHKPQKVTANIPVFYSGSPIPLSFSERADNKRVLIIDTSSGDYQPENIPIPSFRKLLRMTGSLNQLRTKLNGLEDHEGLNSLIEIELIEENYDATVIYQLDEMINNFKKPGYEIVKQRVSFKNKTRGASELYSNDQSLEDLKPQEVFMELIGTHEYDEETKNEIIGAFTEILEETYQNDSGQK